MEEIAISKFKARCSRILEKVRKTRKTIRITKRGRPVAEIVPLPAKAKKKSWLGSMAGTARILGDIVSPASDPEDWEVLR